MSITPDEVAAPARDAMLFRSSPARTFLTMFCTILVTYVAVSPVMSWLFGNSDPWWVAALQGSVIAGLVSGTYVLTARASLRTWVRVSPGGLELAAQGSDPILLAWADIKAVTVRRVRLSTVLDVTPVDFDRVHPVEDEHEGWPTVAETGTAFTADLTQVWPGPRALRRELARYLPPATS